MPRKIPTERPIIFSAPMVQALLVGRKTMMRRVIRTRYPVEFLGGIGDPENDPRFWGYGPCDDGSWALLQDDGDSDCWQIRNPFGTAGDMLYIREGRFMPKVKARIWLRIEEVRAERLQDLTMTDAHAEGIDGEDDEHRTRSAIETFAILWDSLNAKCGVPWSANPWVWVIRFVRVPDYKPMETANAPQTQDPH